ncbi:hypothetical protein Tco_0746462 [Tanacetum coccineum]
MDNIRPRTSSLSPSSRSSTTRTPYRPQRPKKIMKSIWVKKGSTIGSQAVLPQKVRVKGGVMKNLKQTWRPKGNYLDSVNRDNGSYILKQFEQSRRRSQGIKLLVTVVALFENSQDVEELKFNSFLFSQICVRSTMILFTDKGVNLFGCTKSTQDEAFVPVFVAQKIGALGRVNSTRLLCKKIKIKRKGPDWMFDLDLLTPSMNYIPVRKENYAASEGNVSTHDDAEDLDDQQFIVHGPNIHAAQPMHTEESTADKEVSLSSDEQALHDELVNLMHQESLAKLHHDASRTAFEEEKKRIALAKEKECANSTFTLSTAKTPPQSTGNTPTDSDDDVPKDGVFSMVCA